MSVKTIGLGLLLLTIAIVGIPGAYAAVDYTATIQPIFVASCNSVGCHPNAGANLNSWSNVIASNIVTAGDATNSILYKAVNGGGMPPSGSLTSAQKQSIADWINEGALSAAATATATPTPTPTPTPVPEVTPTPVPEVTPTPVPAIVTTPVPEIVPTPIHNSGDSDYNTHDHNNGESDYNTHDHNNGESDHNGGSDSNTRRYGDSDPHTYTILESQYFQKYPWDTTNIR